MRGRGPPPWCNPNSNDREYLCFHYMGCIDVTPEKNILHLISYLWTTGL